jgi:hypothetical protein
MMTTGQKITLYRKFNEGSEYGDAVDRLLDAAHILDGISQDHELALTMLVIEKLIRDYMTMAKHREIEWSEYREIDPVLYTYMLGGACKLTQEQFEG